MPLKCVIRGCRSVQDKNCRLSFFKFPLNDPGLLIQWTAAVNKEFWTPTAFCKICERHFKEEYLAGGKRRKRLKLNAKPTENLGTTVHVRALQHLVDDTKHGIRPCEETVYVHAPWHLVDDTEHEARPCEETVHSHASQHLVDDTEHEARPCEETVHSHASQHLVDDTEHEARPCEETVHSHASQHLVDDTEHEARPCEETVHSHASQHLVDDTEHEARPCEVGNRKRRAIEVEGAHIKIQCLEENILNLEAYVKSLKENHTKELEKQAETYRYLLQEQKDKLKQRIQTATTRIKLLNRQIKRRDEKIDSFLQQAKDKQLLDTESYNTIVDDFQNTFEYIVHNEKKNKAKLPRGRRYDTEVKKFAVTLYYHSPKAYEFCRTTFMLPHPVSIRNWCSTVNAEPGFHQEILNSLKDISRQEDRDCTLMFDSMAIRQQVIWDEKERKFQGFCDYGNDISIERNETEAKEALVFLLVSLKGKWKFPIGYFLKHHMTSSTLAELIKTALVLTEEAGITVRAVTCDGEATNCSALKILGCELFVDNYGDIKNFFLHPSKQYKVRVILDACHMLKLGRNALADYKVFLCDEGHIKWQYLINLHNMQKKLTFRFKNKLTSQCINYQQNKMKVKYAAHTFSASVASAIEFLTKENIPEFQNSEATIKFLHVIDRLFDFMNSRNPFAKGFKKPITNIDLDYLRENTKDHIEYLFKLKTQDGTLLTRSKRRTFICGLAVTTKSILDVASDLFSQNSTFKYLLTYKFSQDYLEILFSKIRSRHGHNNNPNILQFKYAMRQILLHNTIKNYSNTNCMETDDDPIGSVYEFRWKKKKKESLFNDLILENENDDEYDNDQNSINIDVPEHFKNLQDNILYYISGYIAKKLHTNCYTCAISLIEVQGDHCYAHSLECSKLLDLNNNGGLYKPSNSVYKITKITEHVIQIVTNNFTNLQIINLNMKIVNKVKNTLALDPAIFPNLACEDVDLLDIPHKIRLITLIASKYIRIRLYSYAKFYTQEILKPIRKRHRLTKMILFSNE